MNPQFGNVGDRVRAVNFGPSEVVDDNLTVPAGTLGIIDHIDGTGTRHTKWDNGSSIGLIPNVDQWDVLPEPLSLPIPEGTDALVDHLKEAHHADAEELSDWLADYTSKHRHMDFRDHLWHLHDVQHTDVMGHTHPGLEN